MLTGHEELIKTFKRLVKENALSHGYIFFGEPQVGKYSFARSLARYLEAGKFDGDGLLSETFTVEPDEKMTIGIDAVRDLKRFLSQKPVNSEHRVAIIDDAHMLTAHAQNAILKISEEPPEHSLIILVLPYIEVLTETLSSRFQKIYFPRLSSTEVAKVLIEGYGVKSEDAEDIAELSFGRPGRAIDLTVNEEVKEVRKLVLELLKRKRDKKRTIDYLVEENHKLPYFFTDLVAELAKDVLKNYDKLRDITDRMKVMEQFTTNKRLQLESALWTI